MLKSENAIYCGLCKFAVGYFCPILGIFSDDICDDKLQFGCWVGVLYLFGKKKKPSKCKPCPTLTREGSRREAVAVCPHFGRVCSAYHKNRTNGSRTANGNRPRRERLPDQQGGRGGFVQPEGRFICRFAVYRFLRPFPAFLTFPHIPT